MFTAEISSGGAGEGGLFRGVTRKFAGEIQNRRDSIEKLLYLAKKRKRYDELCNGLHITFSPRKGSRGSKGGGAVRRRY